MLYVSGLLLKNEKVFFLKKTTMYFILCYSAHTTRLKCREKPSETK